MLLCTYDVAWRTAAHETITLVGLAGLSCTIGASGGTGALKRGSAVLSQPDCSTPTQTLSAADGLMKSLNEYLCACSTATIGRSAAQCSAVHADYGTKPLDDELRRGGGRLRERRLERRLPVRQLRAHSPQ